MQRRTLSARQARAVDVALIVLVAGTGVARELWYPAGDRRLIDAAPAVYAGVQLLAALTLWWRRTRPADVVLANAALNLISPTQAGYVAAYSLGVSGLSVGALLRFAIQVATWCVGAQLWNLEDPVTGPLMLTAIAVVGLYVGARRFRYDALVARAEHAEREQELAALAAVTADRRRLGAELHDVVTNRVTLMVLQAGALAVSTTDPGVKVTAEEMRAQGVRALEDVRRLLAVVRDETPATASAGSIDAVVTDARRSGMTVACELGAGTDDPLAVRVVREALTNVAKHAPGASVQVRTQSGPDGALVVQVDNGLASRRADEDVRRAGMGSGLATLRRVIAERGGHLDAGPAEQATFRVRAVIPPEAS